MSAALQSCLVSAASQIRSGVDSKSCQAWCWQQHGSSVASAATSDSSSAVVIYALSIGAVTHDFQQCGILTSVDSDQPVQPPFKLRNSK